MTPLQVGLTGNIGSGKSTVARLFAERGAAVIDADVLAREATADPVVLREIAILFGQDLVADGELNRARLAAVVFADPEARARLNAIIHPWVGREREAQVAALSTRTPPPAVIVHDVPLLFEAGLDTEMDKTIVVDAPLVLRLARAVARSGLTSDELRARDAAQLPLAEKVRRADFVLRNDGDMAALRRQVDDLWQKLTVIKTPRSKGGQGGWEQGER
jgi:dephospho-CoA kinase